MIFSRFPCPDPLCQGHTHCVLSDAVSPFCFSFGEENVGFCFQLFLQTHSSLSSPFLLPPSLHTHMYTILLLSLLIMDIQHLWALWGYQTLCWMPGLQRWIRYTPWLQGIHNQLGETDDSNGTEAPYRALSAIWAQTQEHSSLPKECRG